MNRSCRNGFVGGSGDGGAAAAAAAAVFVDPKVVLYFFLSLCKLSQCHYFLLVIIMSERFNSCAPIANERMNSSACGSLSIR